jgi:hypothetical protein
MTAPAFAQTTSPTRGLARTAGTFALNKTSQVTSEARTHKNCSFDYMARRTGREKLDSIASYQPPPRRQRHQSPRLEIPCRKLKFLFHASTSEHKKVSGADTDGSQNRFNLIVSSPVGSPLADICIKKQ